MWAIFLYIEKLDNKRFFKMEKSMYPERARKSQCTLVIVYGSQAFRMDKIRYRELWNVCKMFVIIIFKIQIIYCNRSSYDKVT